jgi:hypothetical protein
MKLEDGEVIRQVMDNLSYVKGYKERLIEFNKEFNSYNNVKVNYNVKEFLFPLEKAI